MGVADSITLSVAVLGAITGIVGTGLAIWSLYRQIDEDRVKLRVSPSCALSAADPNMPFLAISVTNLSKFALTVREVGVLLQDRDQKFIHPSAQLHNGQTLPARMEPRTSISVYFPPDYLRDDAHRTAYVAYAETACQEQIRSPSGLLPNIVEELRRHSGPAT